MVKRLIFHQKHIREEIGGAGRDNEETIQGQSDKTYQQQQRNLMVG